MKREVPKRQKARLSSRCDVHLRFAGWEDSVAVVGMLACAGMEMVLMVPVGEWPMTAVFVVKGA